MSAAEHASTLGSLVDRVYDQVREAILASEYGPGEALRLGRLSEATGASYVPVREALRRLQSEGLVEFTPNKGAKVAAVSLVDVTEIYQMRRLLETEALRSSHARIESAVVARAAGLVDEMAAALASGDRERGMELHREVHYTFYRPAGSGWLLRLIDVLWDNAERYLRRSPGLRSNPQEFGDEHRRFVELAAEPSVDAAVEALRDHLLRTERLLVDAYKRDADSDHP